MPASVIPNSIAIGSLVFAQISCVPKLSTCHPSWLQMDSSDLDPSIYIKLPCLTICVSVFRISEKRADRFP